MSEADPSKSANKGNTLALSPRGSTATFFLFLKFVQKNMADNVLESGPPSAKRPKLSSPALSVTASDGNGKYNRTLFFSTSTTLSLCYLTSSASATDLGGEGDSTRPTLPRQTPNRLDKSVKSV